MLWYYQESYCTTCILGDDYHDTSMLRILFSTLSLLFSLSRSLALSQSLSLPLPQISQSYQSVSYTGNKDCLDILILFTKSLVIMRVYWSVFFITMKLYCILQRLFEISALNNLHKYFHFHRHVLKTLDMLILLPYESFLIKKSPMNYYVPH